MAPWQDFLKNNSDTLLQTGIGLIGGRTASEQATMGLQGFSNGRKQSSTLKFLQQKAPELAQAVQSGAIDAGEAYKLFHQQQAEASKPKNPWMAVGGSLFNTDNQSFLTPPAAAGSGQPKYGMTPLYGEDENGNTVVMQPTTDGRVVASELPKGVKVNNPYDTSRQRAQGTAVGKGQGEAAMAVSGATQMAQDIDRQVNELKANSSLGNVVGPWAGMTPTFLPGSVNAQSRIDQLKGGAFLQARQMLKGGGAITDFEGQKAEAAIARLNQAQSEDDFKAALDDFNTAVQQGAAKLQAQAQGGTPQYQPAQGAQDPLGLR